MTAESNVDLEAPMNLTLLMRPKYVQTGRMVVPFTNAISFPRGRTSDQ
jgi:hypothetical protein